MINKQEVQHIAKLARIELKDKEIGKFQKDLSGILDYFKMLKKADTSKVELIFHPTENFLKKQSLRKDEAKPQLAETINKLVEAAPEKKERYIKVKTVF